MATSHESIAASAPPALPIVRNFIPENNRNRYHDKFPAGDLPITVHETNNPGTDALREGGFFRGGGGEHVVAVHFVVDDKRAVQLLPLDERGKHCGSAVGDKTSVAIETCVKTGMDFKKVRRNLAQLIALIVTDNEAIDWGDGSSRGRFSQDRVKMHNDWSPANPCPRHIRAEGYFPTLMQAVREMSGGGQIRFPATPHEPPPFDGTEKTVNGVVFHPFKKQVTSKGVNRREWADPDSKKTGPEIPEGEKIKVLYWVEGKAVSGNNVWLIGESGSRIWSGGVKEPVP